MPEIKVWTEEGKKSVSISIDECLSVTTKGSDFFVHCQNDLSGAINLDDYNLVLKLKPEIVDEQALELGERREILKAMFGND